MTLRLELLGWKSHGLRSPDHEVKLTPTPRSSPHPVTLIQMPNGAGKTTTLKLLRSALSGDARNWSPDDVRGMFRAGATNINGTFLASLRVNGQPVTFELDLNRPKGEVRYRTTFGKGIVDGHEPPQELRRFLEPSFVNLFIFDGELASKLLEVNQTRAREAVDTVFQVSLLDRLIADFKNNWEEHASRDTVRAEKGLNQRRNVMHKLQERLKELKAEHDRLVKRREELDALIDDSENDYNEALRVDAHLGADLETTRQYHESAKAKVGKVAGDVILKMRDPQALTTIFGDALKRLKQNLDRLKLPRSSSKEFFDELAEMSFCICDRPNTEKTRKAIKANAEKLLDDDEVLVLNNIKFDIASFCGESSASYRAELDDLLKKLNIAVVDRDKAKTKFEALEQKSLSQGGAELRRKKEQLEQYQGERGEVNSSIMEIERDPEPGDDDDTRCLAKLEYLAEQAEIDFATASRTLDLRRRTEIVTAILEDARTKARMELCNMLVQETNKKVTALLRMTPVTVAAIEDRLILRDQVGASVGQTLSVGYAFLTTLFERSTHTLPFVVDSPVGALDVDVRTEVARLLPSVARQIVAFTISSERPGFVRPLHAAAKDVQYLTVFRADHVTPKVKSALRLTKDQVTRNDDGVVVQGRAFFDGFQPDDEEK